jgi:hypothetical protein
MVILLVLLLAFIVLDLASWRWGADSTEGIDSCEWDRRRHWGEDVSDQLSEC